MDRERIIKALECCSTPGVPKCKECPYGPDCTHDKLCDLAMYQILVLLKEEKIAMKPKNTDKVGGNCPVCGLRMARSDKYCSQCGQEMDWE